HHEFRGDVKPDIPQVQLGALLALLHQQRAHLEAGRVAGQQIALQVAEGEAAVDDVLDHQHVPVGQVHVEILDDADHARGTRGAAVRGHRHEVDVHQE